MHMIIGITDNTLSRPPTEVTRYSKCYEFSFNYKTLLQRLTDGGWKKFLESVELFCEKHDIHMPDMKDRHFIVTGRSCQKVDNIKEEHHHRVNIFTAAIYVQFAELKTRFPEDTMELLILSATLDPRDSFRRFKIEGICMLAEKFYPTDFSNQDIHILRNQLEHYEVDVLSHESFHGLSTISELCRRMFETCKSIVYCEIDKIIHLVLTLPVSTTTAKRVFSAMNCVKTTIRNKMGQDFLNDSLKDSLRKVFP